MVGLLLLIVLGVVGVGVLAGLLVVLVRLTDSPKSKPYVPHAWQLPPAGWYPDHNDPNVLRYFDGQAWTSATSPRSWDR